MRHIQNKHDWTYELRPQILVLISLCGLATHDMLFVSLPSMGILLGCAYKISSWRREYRKKMF